jgi:hypothetical protein
METNIKNLKRTENTLNKFIVFILFTFATTACCWLIMLVSPDITNLQRKNFVIARMQKIKNFQDIQGQMKPAVDTIFNKINRFNPGIYAQFEETEIKFLINDIRKIYEDQCIDKRYEVFQDIANVYEIWLFDKKEMWGKSQNVKNFAQNLQDCEIGLKKAQDRLNANK